MPDGSGQGPERIKSIGIKRFFRIAGNVLSYLAMAAGAVFIVATIVVMFQNRKSGDPPTVLNHRIFIVLSGSMSPTFDAGSLIITRVSDPASIQENDIITFMNPADTVATTHRVVEIIRDPDIRFITRGDANRVNDAVPVSPNSLLGKVVLFVPYLGYALSFIRTKQGMAVLLGAAGTLILIPQAVRLIKLVRESGKKGEDEEDAAQV